jgi:membrane protein
LESIRRWLDAHSRGAPSILLRTVDRFAEAQAIEAAAGLAYHTLFSLFPLLLTFTVVGSFFLQDERTVQELVRLISETIPFSQDLIAQNVELVLRKRGAVGAVALVVLLWSASSVFTLLARNISRAWPETAPRNFLKQRLVALGMVGTLFVLLVFSQLSSTVLNLLTRLEIPLGGAGLALYETPIWPVITGIVPWLLVFLLFLGLYRWVPNRNVPWRSALWSALAAALAWEGASAAFTWYLSSGLARYALIYGSLGTVVALLLWVYISSLIVLFSAHLGAAIDWWKEQSAGQV